MSEAGGLRSSRVCPSALLYCTGSTEIQLQMRMNTNNVTASGSTNGAIFMPIAPSICPRIWMVMASQKSCTPPGTPVEVIFDFRKNANPMVMTAAIAVASTVSVLTVMPNHVAVVWWPTSMAPSARIRSVMVANP